MPRRLWRIFGIVLVAVATLSLALPQPARIIAVGDLHGDFAVWREIARDAGMVDKRGRWAGGQATLVQLGDMVDRGPDSRRIVRDLIRLQKEAGKQGGRVIVLVGNHEAMNVIGDLRYTIPDDFGAYATSRSPDFRERFYRASQAQIEAAYRAKDPAMTSEAIRRAWMDATPLGWVEQRLAWAPDGEFGRWVIRNPAVAMVGGNLFVHGGLSAEYSRKPIADINREVADALRARDRSDRSILSDALGPLWYRGLITRDPKVTEIAPGGPPRPDTAEELETVLRAYDVMRIIVGHTPDPSGIRILYGGRLVDVDSGNSSYYRGTPSYLEIVGDRLIPHQLPRPQSSGATKR